MPARRLQVFAICLTLITVSCASSDRRELGYPLQTDFRAFEPRILAEKDSGELDAVLADLASRYESHVAGSDDQALLRTRPRLACRLREADTRRPVRTDALPSASVPIVVDVWVELPSEDTCWIPCRLRFETSDTPAVLVLWQPHDLQP